MKSVRVIMCLILLGLVFRSPLLASDREIWDDYNDIPDMGVSDPLYHFNHAMFQLNDVLYFHLIKPAATGYRTVMPEPARRGISHFFHNLLFPVRFVNHVLQGKLEQASDEIGIFLVNSTAGIIGFRQVAQSHLSRYTHPEDLGQTLGRWQVGEGCYLVLPFFGPSTVRDLAGRVGDYFITPINYARPWEVEWGVSVTDTLNAASFRIGDYEAMKQASLDPYTAMRDGYLQARRAAVID